MEKWLTLTADGGARNELERFVVPESKDLLKNKQTSKEMVCCLFLLLNSIPLHGDTTFCLSVYQLMDIWVVSNFWLV